MHYLDMLKEIVEIYRGLPHGRPKFRMSVELGLSVVSFSRKERNSDIELLARFRRWEDQNEGDIKLDTVARIRVILRSQYLADKVYEDYVSHRKKPKKIDSINLKVRRHKLEVRPYRPIIYVDKETRDEEILVKLCMCAIQQNSSFKGQHELRQYIEQFVRTTATSRLKLNQVDEIVDHLLSHYSMPATPSSFRSYLNILIKSSKLVHPIEYGYGDEEQKNKLEHTKQRTKKNLSVDEFVQNSQLSRSYVYSLIYSGRIKAKVEEEHTEYTTPKGLKVSKLKRKYLLTPENLERLSEIYENREIRRTIVEYRVKEEGITERAARAWLKRRLDRNVPIRDIALEAYQKGGGTQALGS